jgi:hypothetical protein
MGNAAGVCAPAVIAIEVTTPLRQKSCRSAQSKDPKFILFDKFQFELLPDWNAIILRLVATSTRWVSAAQPTSEMPP